MSTPSELTPRPPRRSRRPRKASGHLDQTQTTGNHSEATLTSNENIAPDIPQLHEPPPANRDDEYISYRPTDLNITNPSTPPRARTTESIPTRKSQFNGEASSDRPKHNKYESERSRKTTQSTGPKTSQAKAQHAAGSRGASNSSQTLETPSKAYAGPTFHASPAASSLPLPKFFSKSVPNVDKTNSLEGLVEREAENNNGSEGEASPFMDSHAQLFDGPTREQSPLDIFFRADRKEKAAKLRSLTPEYHAYESTSTRESSASPSRSRLDGRNHSRHPTDGSIGGVFPLEIDGAASESPRPRSSQPRPSSAELPMSQSSDEVREGERRQAQTLALKKMLFSPRSQHESTVVQPTTSSTAHDSLNPSKSSASHGSPTRNAARPAGLASDSSRASRHAALLALAQKQIPTPNSNTSQRPPSSHLRKEVTLPTSPTTKPADEFSSFSSPPPLHKDDAPLFTYRKSPRLASKQAAAKGASSTPEVPETKANSGKSSSDTKSIEDDLRRILKMDVLGGNENTSVRS